MVDLIDLLTQMTLQSVTRMPNAAFRIHPEDMAELREIAKRQAPYPTDDSGSFKLYGVPLIEDESAPRLPRKAP